MNHLYFYIRLQRESEGLPADWSPGLDVVDVLHLLGLGEKLWVSEDVVSHDGLLLHLLLVHPLPAIDINIKA